MSRTITVTDPSRLSEDDKRYLYERGRLPKGVTYEPESTQTPLGDLTHTGTANTVGISTEDLEAELQRRREKELETAEANFETDKKAIAEQRGEGRQDGGSSDVEQYKSSDGWTEDRLRSELTHRELSTDGDRRTLRARLIQNDRSSNDEE